MSDAKRSRRNSNPQYCVAFDRYMLDVFDVTGRRVFEREWDVPGGGYYRIGWGGQDRKGLRVATGVYFLRVRGPAFHELRKVVLVR